MQHEIHLSDDAVEMYALGRLEEPELGRIEEHLLICPACQARVEREDEFVQAARTVLAEPPARAIAMPPRGRRWTGVVIWGGALAAAAAILVVLALRQPHAQTVELIAQRGPEPGAARALTGAPVDLRISTAELVAAPLYTLELADRAGHIVLKKSVEPKRGEVNARLDSLAAGNYWVRLYAPTDEVTPVREFSLLIQPR